MALTEPVGLGLVANGYLSIPAEETIADAAYGLMATPDVIEAVSLPEEGVLLVAYRALVSCDAPGTGHAAIFLNDNQLTGKAGTAGQEAAFVGSGIANWLTVHAIEIGLGAMAAAVSESAVGQLMGLTVITAESGEYDISVRYKATAGSPVHVKERKLRVATFNFATT